MYEYSAEVDRVIDGDTVDLIIDLGFGIFKKDRIRLLGINTPETRTRDKEEKAKGLAAKKRLIELLGKKCLVCTQLDKAGKYGRILGTLYVILENKQPLNINKTLLEEGHAEVYNG